MARNVNPSGSPTAKVMDRAIDLAIEGKSPYPEHAAFIDAESPHAGHENRMGQLATFNGRRRRLRELRREQLTQPERILVWTVFWTTAIGPTLLILAGVLLLLDKGPHAIGIALLLLGLVVMAVPTGPLLRAWGRQRATRRMD